MRRRIPALVACFGATVLLAGCIGAEGKQAETLLRRAALAQDGVTSERFVLRLDVETGGESMTMAMQGGAYLKGPSAGDFYLKLTGSAGSEGGPLNASIMQRGNVAAIEEDGRAERIPVSEAEEEFGSPTDMLDLARYVKSVSVDGTRLRDRPADRIVGILDTKALLESSGELTTKLLGEAGVHLSDIRAVLFVPRDTHLVEVMFADFDVTVHGEKAHVHLSVALSDFDKPVPIPPF